MGFDMLIKPWVRTDGMREKFIGVRVHLCFHTAPAARAP